MNAHSTLDGTPVLVSGASGFIGSHLVEALLKRNCVVHCLVRATSDTKWLPVDQVHLHKTDLRNPELPADCVNEIKHVFHCAGLTISKSRRGFFETNAEACRRLFDALLPRAEQLRSVVHLSSLAAAGPAENGNPIDETTACHPVTYYGQSKLKGEQIALEYATRLPIVVIRPPVVYGEREQNFFTYLKTLKQGWRIQVGNAVRRLSIIHVHDLVAAMLCAAEKPKAGGVFFVTDGEVYTWDEVASQASEILKVTPRQLTLPEGLIRFAALIAEMKADFCNQPALLDRQRVIDICQHAWTASAQQFFDQYDFTPQYKLQRGLQVTLDWYRRQGWL